MLGELGKSNSSFVERFEFLPEEPNKCKIPNGLDGIKRFLSLLPTTLTFGRFWPRPATVSATVLPVRSGPKPLLNAFTGAASHLSGAKTVS